MVLGSTHPLKEITTRNLPGGLKSGRRVRLTTLPPSTRFVQEVMQFVSSRRSSWSQRVPTGWVRWGGLLASQRFQAQSALCSGSVRIAVSVNLLLVPVSRPCMSRLSRRCGSLDFSHPYGSSRIVTGTDLAFSFYCFSRIKE
jgi:hypothetical protein